MTEAAPNYYELLDVPQDASDEAIQTAYRRAAMKYHPDRNPGDAEAEAKFKAVKDAYEVLSDPAKRAEYDATGSVENINIENEAEQILTTMFLQVCQQIAQAQPEMGILGGPSPQRTDPIKLVAAQLNQQEGGIMKAQAANNVAIERFKAILARLRVRKEGVNPEDSMFGDALRQQLTHCHKEAFNHKRHLELVIAMREKIKTYDYIVDTGNPSTTGSWNRGPVTGGKLQLGNGTGG